MEKKEGQKSHDTIPLRGRFRHEAVFKQWGSTKCNHKQEQLLISLFGIKEIAEMTFFT